MQTFLQAQLHSGGTTLGLSFLSVVGYPNLLLLCSPFGCAPATAREGCPERAVNPMIGCYTCKLVPRMRSVHRILKVAGHGMRTARPFTQLAQKHWSFLQHKRFLVCGVVCARVVEVTAGHQAPLKGPNAPPTGVRNTRLSFRCLCGCGEGFSSVSYFASLSNVYIYALPPPHTLTALVPSQQGHARPKPSCNVYTK